MTFLLFKYWFKVLLAGVIISLSSHAYALNCATPGKDGAGGVLSGVINRYWPGSATVTAGSTAISLGASTGGGAAIAAGDLLLVIQMQDAAINTNNNSNYGGNNATGAGSTSLNNAGLYEFVRATTAVGTGGGSVSIVGGGGGGLLNAYTQTGQRRFQVIRVPQYTTATLSSGLTAAPWNGSAGGVLALDVAGQLTLGGTVSVNGLGFRGGAARQLGGGAGSSTDYLSASTVNNNGSKGEGIAGTPRYVNDTGGLLDNGVEGYTNGSHARGAPGNAGGGGTDGNPLSNDQNTGGGGGSNAGGGGRGGNSWSSNLAVGGVGGAAYAASVGTSRVFMGGGGGSGTTNNGTGTPGSGFASSGAAGGGLIVMRAGSISGSGVLTANGAAANSTVDNDGSGGGGAGGSVVVFSNAGSVGGLSVQANGGNGGSNAGGGVFHGPGGGGGGGYVATSGLASVSVNGGNNGTTTTAANAYGAVPGNSGASTSAIGSLPGVSAGGACDIVVSKVFSPTSTGPGGTPTLTVTLTSANNLAITGIVLNDVFPTTPGAMTVATPVATTNTCSGTLQNAAGGTLTAGDNGIRLNLGSLAANGNCSFSVKVNAPVSGSYVNTIPAGALTSTNGGTNGDPASATLTVVTAPVITVTKLVSVFSDPVNGTTNPKYIPGATVLYTVLVNLTGTGSATAITIADPLPANITYVPGSMIVDGVAKTDVADADNAQFASNTVTVTYATLTAPVSATFNFKATVN